VALVTEEAPVPAPNEAPAKPKKRPIKYSDEVAEQLCERIATREPFKDIYDDPTLPAARTVYRWRTTNPEFDRMYHVALESRADARMAKIELYGDELRAGELDPNSARVLVDLELKLASREHPRKHSEKQIVEHGGVNGAPIEFSVNNPVDVIRTLRFVSDAFAKGRSVAEQIASNPPPLINGTATEISGNPDNPTPEDPQ
jgi:hypothetical protein